MTLAAWLDRDHRLAVRVPRGADGRWWDRFGTTPAQDDEFLKLADEMEIFQLRTRRHGECLTKFAAALQRTRDTWYGDLRVVPERDGHAGAWAYRLWHRVNRSGNSDPRPSTSCNGGAAS